MFGMGLKGEGNLLHHLRPCGYRLTHEQSPLHECAMRVLTYFPVPVASPRQSYGEADLAATDAETTLLTTFNRLLFNPSRISKLHCRYNFGVSSLAGDLTDGLRLCKLAEKLTGAPPRLLPVPPLLQSTLLLPLSLAGFNHCAQQPTI